MADETRVTIIGNAVDDVELRFTPNGVPVANFTVASTPRTFDKNSNEWRDGEALFLSCTVWRDYAEHVAESLSKGTAVIVQGNLKARSFDDRDGKRRTVHELDVLEVGPTLRFATAQVQKAGQRQQGAPQTSSGGSGPHSQNRRSGQGGPASGGVDPWAQQGASPEPPF